MGTMKEGLEDTQQAIINAARRAGRDPSEVTLVAVGKTKPASMIRELYDLGVRDFGENKVQELTAKYEELPKDIRWHMIGHLQSNKVNVLLEVNVSGEESKYGLTPAEVEQQIDQFLDLKRVRIRGFMTVAPFAEDPEEVRPYFKRLKQLSVDIQNKTIDNNIDVGLLSMGMSGDFEAAIEEGASFVRVGTRIFGARNYAL